MLVWSIVLVCIPLAAFRGVGLRTFYVGAAFAALLLGAIAVFMTPSQLAYDMLAMATAADPSAGRSNLRMPALLLRYGAVVARSLFAMGVASAVGAVVFRARKAVIDRDLSFPFKGDAEPDLVEPEAGAVQEADYLLMSGDEAPEPDTPEANAAPGSASAGLEAGILDYPLMTGDEPPSAEPEAPPAGSGTGAALAADDMTYALMVGEHAEPAEPRAPATLSGIAAGLQLADVTYALMVGDEAESTEAKAPVARDETAPAIDATGLAFPLTGGDSGGADPDESDERSKGWWRRRGWAGPDD